MPQVVWPDSPGDSGALQGVVPGLLDAGYGLALVSDVLLLHHRLLIPCTKFFSNDSGAELSVTEVDRYFNS